MKGSAQSVEHAVALFTKRADAGSDDAEIVGALDLGIKNDRFDQKKQ